MGHFRLHNHSFHALVLLNVLNVLHPRVQMASIFRKKCIPSFPHKHQKLLQSYFKVQLFTRTADFITRTFFKTTTYQFHVRSKPLASIHIERFKDI
jgi:hypothetical protein